jgi:hypothetical protein
MEIVTAAKGIFMNNKATNGGAVYKLDHWGVSNCRNTGIDLYSTGETIHANFNLYQKEGYSPKNSAA